MKRFNPRHQNGVTLFEILLVLFVIAAITVTVAVGARRATEGAKQKQLLDDVTELVGNIRQLYSTKDDYTGLSNDIIVNAKIAPDNMISSDNSFITLYNTGKDTWSVESGASNQFTLVFSQLPQDACTFLGTQMLGTAISVQMGNNAATNPGAIAAGCNANQQLKLTFN